MLLSGEVDLATIGGFDTNELDAAYSGAARLIEAQRPAKALKVLASLMMLQPSSARTYRLAGVALLHLRQPQLSCRYFRLATAAEGKDDPLTQLYHGEALLLSGEPAAGVKLLNQGISGADPSLKKHVLRGQKLIELHAAGAN